MSSTWERRVLTPDWQSALDVARRINPNATGLSLDEVFSGTEATWSELNGSQPDVQVAEEMWSLIDRPSGLALVVTGASWKSMGPLPIMRLRFDDLVRRHGELFGDTFFSDDVLIVDVDGERLIAASHQGFCAVVGRRDVENHG